MSAADFARLESKVDRLLQYMGPKRPHDDEKIYKEPSAKYWAGESYKGAKLSECPANYLWAFAKYKDACVFMAKKEGKPEKAQFIEKDERIAKLARQWAEYREASGESPPPPAHTSATSAD